MKRLPRLVLLTVVLALFAGACGTPGDGPVTPPARTPKAAPPLDMDTWSVTEENRRPGSTGWRLRDPGPSDAIEGYADHVSVTSGESFRLFVSTTAKSFHVEAYRMGWYQGKQGRKVWSSAAQHGERQAGPKTVPGIYLISAPWKPSLTVNTENWPQGSYLLKLVSSQGHDRWVTLTIRSTSTVGRTVFVNAVTTWAAYNKWGGGTNVYGDSRGTSGPGYAKRSRKASFDRPYDGKGSPFNWYELPMLSIAERMGIPLAYETDTDLDNSAELFRGARSVIFPGHDEYWSAGMRDNTLKIRDAGVNIAFFSSNAAYRHIRLEPSSLGKDRVVVVYKDPSEDPMILKDPSQATQQWRLPPDPRPESVLTGVLYECNPVYAPFVVTDPDAWMFRGTGAKAGSKYIGLVGVESDRLMAGVPVPRPIQVVGDSPLTCRGAKTRANAAYYTVPSGAGVFATGTMSWACSVYGNTGCRDQGGEQRVPEASGEFARQVSENILRVFAAGPAGRTYPARDNYARYVSPPSTMSFAH
ncbi:MULTISPECIES: N,N-dimethylformamidase beta subunit family domain-containing protein [unclassified Streptomyces]|uniref:N,N-dimethylformamidase beta subunit family domain-containing protein n=1 Tax=unclassified Streptomyces TaxID=2593676 RepID=UPI0020349777|nr:MULTISPECIES: N,N-dimethylformamidase beta subunit family domain-containing protein [unclassified Streptomyces]MCM2421051.1 hypothetical protein [Streptomyces sp. RKAG293]MCM2426752.1 hypothetical protein [Streptomyces sp. RKAG337]